MLGSAYLVDHADHDQPQFRKKSGIPVGAFARHHSDHGVDTRTDWCRRLACRLHFAYRRAKGDYIIFAVSVDLLRACASRPMLAAFFCWCSGQRH